MISITDCVLYSNSETVVDEALVWVLRRIHREHTMGKGTRSTQKLTVFSVLELVDGYKNSVHRQRRIAICEGGGLLGMEGGSLYQWHSTT